MFSFEVTWVLSTPNCNLRSELKLESLRTTTWPMILVVWPFIMVTAKLSGRSRAIAGPLILDEALKMMTGT